MKSGIEASLKDLKESIETATSPDELQPKVEALAEASQELGKAVYADQGAAAEGDETAAAEANAQDEDEDVEDVEVIEEDEPAAKA